MCAHIVNMFREMCRTIYFFENSLSRGYNGTKITEKTHLNYEIDPFKDFLLDCARMYKATVFGT